MRGKPAVAADAFTGLGNIPAYAGKTRRINVIWLSLTEHPRVCGENQIHQEIYSEKHGTSPRMRGKRRCRPYPPVSRGNIPAYAGKTSNIIGRRSGATEHPRVCGENSPKPAANSPDTGTSPRMRGKPSVIAVACDRVGNIPAYAGKTLAPIIRGLPPKEHPRVCGENRRPRGGFRGLKGTSPRMRGKRSDKLGGRSGAGNIPAYAGKTPQAAMLLGLGGEHPRVCGENPY